MFLTLAHATIFGGKIEKANHLTIVFHKEFTERRDMREPIEFEGREERGVHYRLSRRRWIVSFLLFCGTHKP